MAESLLAFILHRLEQFPSAKFRGADLRKHDAVEFERLRQYQFLKFVQELPDRSLAPCPSTSACQAPGRNVISSQGKLWAVCSCPANEPPVEIAHELLHRFEFDLPAFVAALRKSIGLYRQQGALCERTFLVGESALPQLHQLVVFALLDQGSQSVAILEALYSRLPSSTQRIIVLTPSFLPSPTDAVRLEARGIMVVSGVISETFTFDESGQATGRRADSPSVWPDDYFKSEDGTWLTAKVLKERFGIPDSRLKEWRDEGCPDLGGRKLAAKRVGGVGWVYFRMDASEIANRRDEKSQVGDALSIQARLDAASVLKRQQAATDAEDSR